LNISYTKKQKNCTPFDHAAIALTSITALVFYSRLWYGLSYALTPHMDNPDGIAKKITGNCGNTWNLACK